MTRGLYPPDTLTKDDIRTLNQVRKDLWYNSFIGGGFGAGTGLILHTSAQWARRLGMTSVKLNRNTLMLSVLGGGAFGMFLFGVAAGKEQVHNLHPIFLIGATPPGELDRQDYRSKIIHASQPSDDLDIKKLQEIRIARRTSMMDGFQKGHGLNDAHGGHWVKDNEN